MGQLNWEPPARQLGAGQSQREEFHAGEMSLWEAGEAAGAVPLHKSTGVGLWRGTEAFPTVLPVFCKALDSASIPSSAHFSLLPSHFIASQGTGLVSAISSPLILLSPLWAALGLPPFLPLFHPGQPPACLAWGGRRAPGTPLLPSLAFQDVPSLPWPG